MLMVHLSLLFFVFAHIRDFILSKTYMYSPNAWISGIIMLLNLWQQLLWVMFYLWTNVFLGCYRYIKSYLVFLTSRIYVWWLYCWRTHFTKILYFHFILPSVMWCNCYTYFYIHSIGSSNPLGYKQIIKYQLPLYCN